MDVESVLLQQDGVIRRAQALECGMAPHEIRRMVRRNEWAIVHPGVYVNHTGPLPWLQRAWAGVLSVWPGALCGESALRAT
ncbi:MAG TPA: type IV toxin-antitoxin system AbiEi family antitoxin domain-containing protein [Nocardioidaceae bacterium]|nr:type IV toxin-antitoxin system AbiEi family antitoxin domain-containing protein [Nocardioidaceae bacterium]